MVKDNKDFNMELLNTIAPSGYEKPSVDVFDKYMEKNGCVRVISDKMHNSAWRLGAALPAVQNFIDKETQLIEAHIE